MMHAPEWLNTLAELIGYGVLGVGVAMFAFGVIGGAAVWLIDRAIMLTIGRSLW